MRQERKRADFLMARALLTDTRKSMRLPTLANRVLVTLAALSPASAFAHPGHDGGHDGGLTWDFAGEVLHRLTSPYHLAPVFAAAVLTLVVLRLVMSKKNRAPAKDAGREKS